MQQPQYLEHKKGKKNKTPIKPLRTKVINFERQCNICHQLFLPKVKHGLFCEQCRENSEVFQFHQWLPKAEGAL